MQSRKWLATLLATLLIFSTVASDIMVVCAEEAVEETVVEETTEEVDASESQEVSVEVVENEEITMDDQDANTEEISEEGTDAIEIISEEASEDTATEENADVVEDAETTENVDAEGVETAEDAEVDELLETEVAAERNMPACDFGTFDVAGMSVAISAPEGAFPEGTTVEVKEVSFPVEKIEGQLEDGKEIVEMKAVDITFYFEGEEIQPKNEISVVFANANLAGEEVSVFHEKNGSVEEVDTISASADGAVITASSFSVYILLAIEEQIVDDTLTVTFDLNGKGEKGQEPSPVNAKWEDVIRLPEVNIEGLEFVGWSTAANANDKGKYTESVFPAGSMYTLGYRDVTLYAIWADTNLDAWFSIRTDGSIPCEPQNNKPAGYTQKMKVQGAISSGRFVCDTVNGVDNYLLHTPSNETIKAALQAEGISFDETKQRVFWYVIKRESDGWHVDGVVISQDKCNLSYVANAPSGKFSNIPEGQQYEVKTKATVSSKQPTREDYYDFTGWNTKADGSGESYRPGSEIDMVGNIVLYAQWQRRTVQAKLFVYNPGTDRTTIEKVYNEEKNAPIGTAITHVDVADFTVAVGTATVSNCVLSQYNSVKADAFGHKISQKYVYDYNIGSSFLGSDGKTLFMEYGKKLYSANKDDIVWYVVKNESDGWHVDGFVSQWKESKPEITVKAVDIEKTYDGKPVSLSDNQKEAFYSLDGTLLPNHKLYVQTKVNGEYINVSDTSADKHVIEKVVIRDAEDKDVTSQYKVTLSPGDVVIKPVQLTITTESATKTYDSTPLTAGGEVIGFVNGEETLVDFSTTGSQTEVDSSINTYSLVWGDVKAENYVVTENLGTLTVTAAPVVPPTEPTPGPTEPTPEPGDGPTPDTTPTPDDVAVVNIADEATPLAAAGDVLGARRGVEADGGSVLGARRVKAVLGARRGAQTADENAMAMYMAMMGISASFAGLYTIARRKKRSANN